jgi:hypothetical protein
MNSRREDGSVLLGWPLKNILQPLVPEMPRITPVHWKVLEKVFLTAGFQFARQEGSHRSYTVLIQNLGFPGPL